jgi:hypothetical protein
MRPVRVVMDPDLGRYPVVWAAAGTSSAVFPVPPATLRSLANATVAPIAEEGAGTDGAGARDGAGGSNLSGGERGSNLSGGAGSDMIGPPVAGRAGGLPGTSA